MLLVSCRCDGRRTLKGTFGVIVANISKVFCDRGRIIWYVGSSEMLIALLQTTRRHISKQHNHLLTVLCEGTEEDVGLPERERDVQSLCWNLVIDCTNPLVELSLTNCIVLLTDRMIDWCKWSSALRRDDTRWTNYWQLYEVLVSRSPIFRNWWFV
jgi:hypothetical protein